MIQHYFRRKFILKYLLKIDGGKIVEIEFITLQATRNECRQTQSQKQTKQHERLDEASVSFRFGSAFLLVCAGLFLAYLVFPINPDRSSWFSFTSMSEFNSSPYPGEARKTFSSTLAGVFPSSSIGTTSHGNDQNSRSSMRFFDVGQALFTRINYRPDLHTSRLYTIFDI